MGSAVRYRSRHLGALGLISGAVAVGGAAQPGEDVSATVTGLRNGQGMVMACLTANPASFPDCRTDPAARKLVAPAAGVVQLDFGPMPAGTYAISLFHDENRNGRLDKAMMMPREGYGFSRDAKVRFGPPRFAEAAFAVGQSPVHQTIRMRYML